MQQATAPLRDVAVEVIRKLPRTSSAEEIMYQINFVANVLQGLQDADEGKTYTTEEVLKKLELWRK